jgi:hypothetical protein
MSVAFAFIPKRVIVFFPGKVYRRSMLALQFGYSRSESILTGLLFCYSLTLDKAFEYFTSLVLRRGKKLVSFAWRNILKGRTKTLYLLMITNPSHATNCSLKIISRCVLISSCNSVDSNQKFAAPSVVSKQIST